MKNNYFKKIKKNYMLLQILLFNINKYQKLQMKNNYFKKLKTKIKDVITDVIVVIYNKYSETPT